MRKTYNDKTRATRWAKKTNRDFKFKPSILHPSTQEVMVLKESVIGIEDSMEFFLTFDKETKKFKSMSWGSTKLWGTDTIGKAIREINRGI